MTDIDVWMERRRIENNRLYERYGKPLESEHWGKFVAISPKGETLLGTDMDEVFLRALDETGRGFFLFKVGEKAAGRL